MTATTLAKPSRLRCAIYTRKSTEEGLEMEFNTLDAQREAGEAYVASQKHLGWELSPTRYDDGGFTGANMDRPALTRLLADIDAGKVDIIVVYKVDRLSRSLLDFARLIEVFERQRVGFVSVTQAFDTSQSMGRLVLNVLLSFAQFEREMIGERTRDKVSAARRKGKWTGGRPPLGYDVVAEGGRLEVNPTEAEQVREIFALYLEHRSLLRVVELLNGRGWRTKSWTVRSGARHEGTRWEKSSLRKLLTNVLYVGKVPLRDEVHAGEHPGIVDPAVFARAAEALKTGKRDRTRTTNKHGFLLRGLVHCTACGSVMTSVTASPRGKPYRYYSCTAARRRGTGECPVRQVSAPELEAFVVARIRDIGRDPALLQETLAALEAERDAEKPHIEKELRMLSSDLAGGRAESRKLVAAMAAGGHTPSLTSRLTELDQRAVELETRMAELQGRLAAIEAETVDPEAVRKALRDFDPVWDALVPREKVALLGLLVERVDYDGTDVSIALRGEGVRRAA